MKTYAKYKDSGVPWLGEVPEHWSLKRNKVFFSERKEIVGDSHSEYKLLSLTLKGIIYRDLENTKGKFPADFSTYQAVRPNDFVFCFFDVDETPRTVGLSTLSGMITGAYTVLSTKEINQKFLYYYYLCIDNGKGLRPLYKGLRKTVPFDAFMASKLPVPLQEEQQQIARYLDWQTAKINKFIKAKKKLITLLKEQKQNIINEAVTKGINPDVEKKDSGVEWLGEIPVHWEVKKIRHEFICLNNQRIPLSSVERGNMKNQKYDYYGASGIIDKVDEFIFDDDLLLIAEDGANLILRNLPLAIIARGKFWVNNHAHILKPRKSHLEFLAYALEQIDYTPWISGAAQPKLTKERLLNIKIACPQLIEQQKIINYIKKKTVTLNKTIFRTEREIELIEEYRTRLVSDVVTGKVDVRSVEIPDFEPAESNPEVQEDEEYFEDKLIMEGS